jgi:hypothetical protein
MHTTEAGHVIYICQTFIVFNRKEMDNKRIERKQVTIIEATPLK